MAGSVPCGSGSGSVSNSMVQRSGVSVPSGWFWNNALRNQGVAGVPLSSTIRLAPQGQDSINNLVRLGFILGGRLLGSTGLVARWTWSSFECHCRQNMRSNSRPFTLSSIAVLCEAER